MINQESYGLFLEETEYKKQIEKLTKNCDLDLFRATLYRPTSMSQTREELLAGVNILSQVTSETFQDDDI